MVPVIYQTGAPTGTMGDPLLSAVLNYTAEVDRLNAAADYDQTADDRFCVVLEDLCDHTPSCTSDEGAFAALALAAREMEENEQSDLHDALVAAVLEYAHRRSLDA